MKLLRLWAVIKKDLYLYFSNRFYAVITIVMIAFSFGVYFLLPSTVDDTVKMGIFAPGITIDTMEEEGLSLVPFTSEQEMKNAVEGGELIAGLSLPDSIMQLFLFYQMSGEGDGSPDFPVPGSFAPSEKMTVTAWLASDIPEEYRASIPVLVEELAFASLGIPLPVDINTGILGENMMETPVNPRQQLLPLLVSLLILIEIMGLGNLIAEEIQSRTLNALIVTPLKAGEVMTAKAVTGLSLALVQVIVFMLIVGGLAQGAALIIAALFLGSLLVTAVGFLLGTFARDFLTITAWGMPVLIILFLPGFGSFFPGLTSGWVRFIPSYYLVDTLNSVMIFDGGWSDVWKNLIILLGIDIVLLVPGTLFLKRRCI